jgi:predicted nucleic-acid-binding protein
MRAADTNVILRLILRDDTHQTAVAEQFIRGGVWLSVLGLAETVWVLGRIYDFGSQDLIAAIEMLLREHDLILQDVDAVQDALDLFRSRPALGFSDCLMLSLARKAGHLPLGTFDRNLGRAEGAHKL